MAMFVPLFIIIIFNTKRTADISSDDSQNIDDFDSYQDKAASVTFKYDPNVFEKVFICFYMIAMIFSPCFL